MYHIFIYIYIVHLMCWLVFLNLMQTRVTWEEVTTLSNCLHQISQCVIFMIID